MSVVLPGISDSPMNLDIELSVAFGGGNRYNTGQRRGVAARCVALVDAARSTPYSSGRQLCRDEHVGTVVFDSLKCANDVAELSASVGVLGGHVGACVRDTDCFGGEQYAGAVNQDAVPTHQDVRRCSVNDQSPCSSGGVKVSRDCDRDLG